MKLNNEKSRSLGSLVKKVNTDGANIAEVAGIALVAKTSVDTLV